MGLELLATDRTLDQLLRDVARHQTLLAECMTAGEDYHRHVRRWYHQLVTYGTRAILYFGHYSLLERCLVVDVAAPALSKPTVVVAVAAFTTLFEESLSDLHRQLSEDIMIH